MGKKRKREASEGRIREKIRKLEEKLNKRQRISIGSSDGEKTELFTAETPWDYEISPIPSTEELQPGPSSPARPPSPTPELAAAPLPPAEPLVQVPEVATADDTGTTQVDLGEDILLLLGDAPEPETALGTAIHNDIASRWQDVLKKGLSKEAKDKIIKEYLIPKNCESLVPPILNPEAKAALPEQLVKRDASLLARQKQLSVALSALARAIETVVSNKDPSVQDFKQKTLKPLSDACRLLCDMHHIETKTRRKFVITSINSTLKDTLLGSSTDKFLFGDNMSEKLKVAKNVQKSGEALKVPQKAAQQKNTFANKGYSNLNRSNFKPLHQRVAGRPDAGKMPAAARAPASSVLPRRAREGSPPPPARGPLRRPARRR